MRNRVVNRILVPFFVLFPFAVYVWTLSRGAFPGESAGLIVNHTGLNPFGALSQPIWGVFVRLLAAIPVGDLALRLNLFSALCGALSVGLLYLIVDSIPHNKTREENRLGFGMRHVQHISGASAALFYAFSVPFWSVSTRAHHLTFDSLLLLACCWLFLQVWRTQRLRTLYLFAFLYGIGTVQSASFLLAAPFFAGFLLFNLWQREQLKWGHFLRLMGFALLGWSLIFPAAYRFYLSPAYEWRAFDGYFELLWVLVRDQGHTALSPFRQVGWILLLLSTLAPWLAVVAITKEAASEKSSRIASLLLHLIVAGLGGLLLFNLPPSPLTVLPDGSALALPYLLSAVWIGYVTGYWYAILSAVGAGFRSPRTPTRLGIGFSRTWVALVAIALSLAAVRNLPLADGRRAQAFDVMARAVVNQMEGRTWLLSNGVLDPHIQIAAAEKNSEMIVLNMRLSRFSEYRRYMASLFDDPRLRGLAQLGLSPLLREWLESDPGIGEHLAILAAPDIWVDTGFTPIPQVALFHGVRRGDEPDVDPAEYLARHRAFWDELLALPVSDPDHPSHRREQWLRSHASKVANNAGVFLEDQTHHEKAFTCYTMARRLDKDNISALMNQLSLATRRNRPEVEILEKELDKLLEARTDRLNLWALSAHYGYVRDPQAYIQQGMAWARSGRVGSAVSEVERAMELTGPQRSLRHMLGSLYMRDARLEEGEELYRQLLEEDPDDVQAMLTLARLALARGESDAARDGLATLRQKGVPERHLRVEEASLLLMEGAREEAREMLAVQTEEHPEDARAWRLWLMLAADAGDTAAIGRARERMSRVERPSPEVLLVLAQAHEMQGDVTGTRAALTRVIQHHPGNVPALEHLLRLEVREGDRDAARRRVEQLLSADSGNALGNYILGSLQVAQGEYALAENSYRRSLDRREIPEALNDLAWLLQLRGQYDEAYPLSRRAILLNPRNAYAWSTYGAVLMHLGNLDEAEESLYRALELSAGNPLIQLNLAELFEKRGRYDDALELVEQIMEELAALPDADARRALELSTRLRKK